MTHLRQLDGDSRAAIEPLRELQQGQRPAARHGPSLQVHRTGPSGTHPMKRLLHGLALAIACAFACASAQAQTPSPDEDFDTRLVQALQRAHPSANPKLSEDRQTIDMNGSVTGLENIRREIRRRGLQGSAAVDFALEGIERGLQAAKTPQAVPDSWEQARPMLMPNVAPAEFAKAARCRELSRLTARCFVIDTPTTKAYVMEKRFAAWGVTQEQLEAAAMENLSKITDLAQLKLKRRGLQVMFVISERGDSYDATRLLLPQVQDYLRKQLGGPAFVAIPNRSFLIAWAPGRQDQMDLVAQVVEDFRRQSHPLTYELFVVDAGGLRPARDQEVFSGVIDAPAAAASTP